MCNFAIKQKLMKRTTLFFAIAFVASFISVGCNNDEANEKSLPAPSADSTQIVSNTKGDSGQNDSTSNPKDSIPNDSIPGSSIPNDTIPGGTGNTETGSIGDNGGNSTGNTDNGGIDGNPNASGGSGNSSIEFKSGNYAPIEYLKTIEIKDGTVVYFGNFSERILDCCVLDNDAARVVYAIETPELSYWWRKVSLTGDVYSMARPEVARDGTEYYYLRIKTIDKQKPDVSGRVSILLPFISGTIPYSPISKDDLPLVMLNVMKYGFVYYMLKGTKGTETCYVLSSVLMSMLWSVYDEQGNNATDYYDPQELKNNWTWTCIYYNSDLNTN